METRFQKRQKEKELETRCTICLEQTTPKDTLRFCCSANFHQSCLRQWCISAAYNCPICTRQITRDDLDDVNYIPPEE